MKSHTDKFGNFLRSFGAARLLLQKAHEHGFLLEGLVLYAALVDGFCRICLILKEQLENQTHQINEAYIYQDIDEKNFSERNIYSLALAKGIISQQLFNEINYLYDIRNKFVHRFFISEIEYSHLEIVLGRYEKVYEQLYRITYSLEEDQIIRGIGMTRPGGRLTEDEEARTRRDIYKKIKSGSERNLAKTLNYISVKEVMEFADKHGLADMCVCGCYKVSHIDMSAMRKERSKNMENYIAGCLSKGCSCAKYVKSETANI